SLRLFYSGYLGASALSAAPDVVDVHAVANNSGGVDVSAHVVGNPAAGIQQAWITYTGDGPSRWAPLDLTRDPSDSTLRTGTVPLVSVPGQTTVKASFAGDSSYLPSSASAPFTLAKAPSSLSAFSQQFAVVTGEGDTGMTTTLTAAFGLKTQPLLQQTVTFVV